MIKTITFRTDWIKRIRSKALSLKTFKTLLNKRMRMRRTEIRVKMWSIFKTSFLVSLIPLARIIKLV